MTYEHLNQDERYQISALLKAGLAISKIAQIHGWIGVRIVAHIRCAAGRRENVMSRQLAFVIACSASLMIIRYGGRKATNLQRRARANLQASRRGGGRRRLLSFGGVRVSDAETTALREISQILGVCERFANEAGVVRAFELHLSKLGMQPYQRFRDRYF